MEKRVFSNDFILGNDILFTLSDNDLRELLVRIKKYNLHLRKSINLDNDITFGFEIEFENADLFPITHEIKKVNSAWEITDDVTLSIKDGSKVYGGEAISPILIDKIECWQELRKVCNILNNNRAYIWDNSGGHINFGTQILDGKEETWLNLFKLWSIYENIIYRFGYNESCRERTLISYSAKPISDIFYKYSRNGTNIDMIMETLKQSKIYALSLKKVKSHHYDKDNVIEIRCPNGTINPIIWQNNTNFFAKLLQYSMSCDIEYLNYLFNKSNSMNLLSYRIMDIRKALQLGDLIYDNNLDKLYFLKQYYKDNDQGLTRKIKGKKII